MKKIINILGFTLSAFAILAVAAIAIATVWGSLASVTSIVNGVFSNQRMIEVEKEHTKQTEIEWTERTKQTQIEWNGRVGIAQIEGDTAVKVEHIQGRSTFWYNMRFLMILAGLLLLVYQLKGRSIYRLHG